MKKVNYIPHFKKAIFFIFLLSFLAIVPIWIYLTGKKPKKHLCKDCNVILVSLDTLSSNHLPCYGYERNTAPYLCSFAKENLLFKNMYANAPWTLPSHVSIFTGLLPESHRINFYGDRLDPEVTFLPSVLKENGYKTLFFIPPDDPTLPKETVYNRGIDYFFDSHKNSWNEALDLFRANVSQNNKTFLFLHTYAVHDPYLIGSFQQLYQTKKQFNLPKNGEEIWGNFSDEFLKYFINQLPKDVYEKISYLPNPEPLLDCVHKYKINKADGTLCIKKYSNDHPAETHDYFYNFYWINKINTSDPDQIEYIKALYDQKIRELDGTLIRNLISFWQNEDIRKNTVLIITSDHGEEFMEHGHISHITVYDSNLRIPLIVALPRNVKKEVSYPSESADITPTILDILGIDKDSNFQGLSLVNAISDKPEDRITVADMWHLTDKTIRKDGWKLFLKRENDDLRPYQLFNTDTDPLESTNVMFSNLDKVNELKEEYANFMGK